MGLMWFDGPLWSDGLPLFSVLCSLPLFSVLCSLFVGLHGSKKSWVEVWVFGLEHGSKQS